MLRIKYSSQFKRDFKLIQKQRKNLDKLKQILFLLTNCKPIPRKYCLHNLKGNFDNFFELHIEPDWLLIFEIDLKNNLLCLERTGSHANLFKK